MVSSVVRPNAWRRDPGPLSAVLVTSRVFPGEAGETVDWIGAEA
jgi:hypothetical protein